MGRGGKSSPATGRNKVARLQGEGRNRAKGDRARATGGGMRSVGGLAGAIASSINFI